MTTIYQALAAVMGEVQGVGKHQKNTTPGQSYNFRGIDAVTNAIGPALRKHGVIVVPFVESAEYETVVVGKNRTEMGSARVVITFTWYGPEGDSIVSRTAGEAFDSGDKATAKAHSVAFRTAMIQTLCLPTDEPDPDEQSYERSAAPAPDPLAVAKNNVWSLAQRKGLDKAGLAADYSVWSQGKELSAATPDDLGQYAKTLEPTTAVRRNAS